jgi:E3 ubiquitin-protein ligase RBBP6
MSVHYKFKSALSYDTITFDGLHISVRDLKKAILQQKQIGKATDFDLQITNAQSNEGNPTSPLITALLSLSFILYSLFYCELIWIGMVA